jgi:hypothetical protein
MVSPGLDAQTNEECVKSGCSAFLVKPLSVYVLHGNLQDCITYAGGRKRKFMRAALEKKYS